MKFTNFNHLLNCKFTSISQLNNTSQPTVPNAHTLETRCQKRNAWGFVWLCWRTEFCIGDISVLKRVMELQLT